ncbi:MULTISPECIES: flagellar filament capping protein FliD [Gammaproteobacteria]|uniref:flagellar filament capping protein FliD n=1 Tax=Gammaproteobacteria TaxID=1236 RepID=UPI000DCFE3F0|nr:MULTISPECIES: flagellar filament capping protein FliD [Gammaproteobacteria]RTE86148.1 flagellar hook protein [Aliidiomarina sp. B3213]TCZ91501.1 flagellar hook protein [Lysobacter sp. N42]
MGVSSLGIGSGLALDDLLAQLVQAERAPRIAALDKREDETKVQISAIGKLRSAMNALRTPLDTLGDPDRMQARAATVSNPDSDNPYFTMESSRSAARGNYSIEVLDLARGTRAESGAFTGVDQEITTASGNLTFATQDGEDSFSVAVGANASLEDIARAINESDDNFGVSASLINTGGSTPETRLVFTSDKTGEDKELIVSNDNEELDSVSTVATGAGPAGMTIDAEDSAADARISIDGIEAFSSTNTFENTIQNTSITVLRETGTEGAIDASVDYDAEGVKSAIESFVSAYNKLIDEINNSTKYRPAGEDGESKSGPLIGDSMVRSIQSTFSSIVAGSTGSGEINNLFQIGLTFDSDGKLEFSSDSIGDQGTGKQRLTNALEENFDAVAEMFSGENGIASRLDTLVTQYGQSGGLLQARSQAVQSQQELIKDEREAFERYIENYEETQRKRFAGLDSTITSLQSNANMMFAQLGMA